MLDRISLRQFREWYAFWELKGPSSEERMDWRFAQVCALVANAAGGKKSGSFKVKDFMPQFDKAGNRQTPAQMQAVLKAMAGAMNQQQQQQVTPDETEEGAP